MTGAIGVFAYDRDELGNGDINATSTCDCAFQADFAAECM